MMKAHVLCAQHVGRAMALPQLRYHLNVVSNRQGVGNETSGHCQANEESFNFLHGATCLSSLRCGLLTLRKVGTKKENFPASASPWYQRRHNELARQ